MASLHQHNHLELPTGSNRLYSGASHSQMKIPASRIDEFWIRCKVCRFPGHGWKLKVNFNDADNIVLGNTTFYGASIVPGLESLPLVAT